MKKYKNIELKTKKFIDEGFGQWLVTISDNDWKELLVVAKKSVMQQVEVPGFRKGKVPPHIAQQHISEGAVLKNAANKAVKVAYQYGLDNQEEYDVKVTNQPEVKITDVSNEACKLTFTFDLPLEIELKKYQNLGVIKPAIKVSKSEIDQQISSLKDRFAVYSTKEKGKLEKGDIAIFDFIGTIEGKQFPGNSGENFELEIGSKRFIPGFEDQMIGMKIGEQRVVKVKFPKNYHVENLVAKEAEFSVDLKEIKIKKVNDDNDELVKDVNIPNVNTYDELVSYVKEELTKQKTSNIREKVIEEIFTNILKSSKVVIPRTVINNETDRLINEFKQELSRKDITFEQYKTMTGFTDELIRLEVQEDALWQLQTFIITEEVIKVQNIEATDNEIDDYLQVVANQLNMPIAEIKTTIKDLSLVATTLKRKKALEWIFENNIKEEAPKPKKTASK